MPKSQRAYVIAKVGTVAVTAMALLIALFGSRSVFSLVTLAWSALASALGPLMLVRVLRKPVAPAVGVSMMLAGLLGVVIWRFVLALSDEVYDVLPGMVTGIVTYLALQLVLQPKTTRAS